MNFVECWQADVTSAITVTEIHLYFVTGHHIAWNVNKFYALIYKIKQSA